MFPKRMNPGFRGTNDAEVPHRDFVVLLADLFGLARYRRASPRGAPSLRRTKKTFPDNLAFWNEARAGGLREGLRVALSGFYVTDWVPTSPGLHFTPEAEEAREFAGRYYSEDLDEYLPLGKENMVLGGVGSVRLKSRFFGDERRHVLCATRSRASEEHRAASHEGIPIILKQSTLDKARLTDDHIGFLADLRGTLWTLPENIELIRHPVGVPKYYLFVDRLDVDRLSELDEVVATVSVAYPTSQYRNDPYGRGPEYRHGRYTTLLKKGWSFYTFDTAGGLPAVQEAARWLKDYAGRYSDGSDVPFLSPFDEHYDHFGNPVEFPLRAIQDGRIDPYPLAVYHHHYKFDIRDCAGVYIDQSRKGVDFGSGNNIGDVQIRNVAGLDVIETPGAELREPRSRTWTIPARVDEIREELIGSTGANQDLLDRIDEDLRQAKEASMDRDFRGTVCHLDAARERLGTACGSFPGGAALAEAVAGVIQEVEAFS